jgi:hypothetical protein
MVGVKRPARETDRSGTKKVKVLNQATSRPRRPGTASSKDVPAQRSQEDGAATNDESHSESSGEEDGEAFKEGSEPTRSTEPSKRTQRAEGAENATRDGRCPCSISHVVVCL